MAIHYPPIFTQSQLLQTYISEKIVSSFLFGQINSPATIYPNKEDL